MKGISIAVAIVFLSVSAYSAEIEGVPSIIDGDTLSIGGKKIRIHGIDAPEINQECQYPGGVYLCGRFATEAIYKILLSKAVSCEQRDVDKYKRIVAVCWSGGLDVGAEMVRQGWARAYVAYSRDYLSQEAEAARERRGIWQGWHEAPWDWRKSRK